MGMKRAFTLILVLVAMISCLGANAFAMEELQNKDNMSMTVKAMGKFDIEIPGNTAVKASTSFPLEVGEIVTIKAIYSPFSASVDFGLIAPDGLFYGLNSSDGSFDEAIEVDQRGYYTLAIRNNSSETINVSGYVNY